jgi:hypothetical protein
VIVPDRLETRAQPVVLFEQPRDPLPYAVLLFLERPEVKQAAAAESERAEQDAEHDDDRDRRRMTRH